MRKKLVLKNKRRFTIFIMLLLLITIISIYTTTVYSYKSPQYNSVIVKPGDTLWSIAQECGNSKDIRKLVHSIKKINNLTGSEIYAGTELLIPFE
ncbi:MAG: LysM peptidoglycan-binding domain-containing protein [Clostridia bacterium]|nr:LysM peptidoglycan-binding domain-containing protein [Clostridia bacterium]